MITKLSYKEWNEIPNKDDEVNITLNKNDIVYKINNLWCACETKNESNNILVFSDVFTIDNIKAMLMFVYILGTKENIEYITVTSSPNRYNIFKKIFYKYGAFPPTENNRDCLYFHLTKECLDSVYEHIKNSKF